MFSFPYMVPHDLPPELQILKKQKQNKFWNQYIYIEIQINSSLDSTAKQLSYNKHFYSPQ